LGKTSINAALVSDNDAELALVDVFIDL